MVEVGEGAVEEVVVPIRNQKRIVLQSTTNQTQEATQRTLQKSRRRWPPSEMRYVCAHIILVPMLLPTAQCLHPPKLMNLTRLFLTL